MQPTRLALSALLCALLPLSACGAEVDSPAPETGDGPHVAIDIAALQLLGIADACWNIEVSNGAGQTVFSRTISSSQYGDNAGSASYVGPCDASADLKDNTVTVNLLGIYPETVTDCASPPAAEPFENPSPLVQRFECLDNEDVAVSFNVTVLRPAQQGFFDIAVNFGTIYCSSKIDCCKDIDDDGTCDDDLELLHQPGGGRGSTVVVGFACAAGDASTDTFLYMNDLEIVCDDTTVATITPEGAGNLCNPTGGPCVGVTDEVHDLLYQVAVYRGKEQLNNVDKVYWNLALGVNKANFPAGEDCRLTFSGTADDNLSVGSSPGAQDGVVRAGDVYPYLVGNVSLSDAGGAWACAEHPVNGPGGGVTTTYTNTTGGPTPFTWCYDPDGGCISNGPCVCPAGSVCDATGTSCLPCQQYTAPFETDPLADGWVVLDGDGDTTTTWVAPGADDGFIRMTQEIQDERGIVYHPTEVIPTGDASISFDFRIDDTGAYNSADGVAFTIVNLAGATTMATLVAGTEFGGGVGYHYPEAITSLGYATSAVTIEIDQFRNTNDGSSWTEPNEINDPHLAVHVGLNSRPSGLVDLVALPGIADGQWHQVTVDIVGGTLRISVDGVEELTSTPGVSFGGGHMFFSASTGFAADLHDIDSLNILGGCGP